MALHRYFLITSLPPLGEPGSPPPIEPSELLDKMSDFHQPRELTATILLADDLQSRQSFMAGEIDTVTPVVLTPAQARNEQPLPESLAPHETGGLGRGRRVPADDVWAAYYRHADQVAKATGSEFLARWVSFEVSLRNALVSERAVALGLEPGEYLVVPELAGEPINFSQTLTEWASARNPLEGLRALDRRRWSWLRENDAWFSFSDDELAAYAAKLMLLHRWHRLTSAEQERVTK